MRRCVWSRNLVNEEAIAHWGLLRKKKILSLVFYSIFTIWDLILELNIRQLWKSERRVQEAQGIEQLLKNKLNLNRLALFFTRNGSGKDWFYWALTTAVRKRFPTNNLFRNTSFVLQGLIYYSLWIKLGHKKRILHKTDTLYAVPHSHSHGHEFFVVKYFALASSVGNLIKFNLLWIQTALLTLCIVCLLIHDTKFNVGRDSDRLRVDRYGSRIPIGYVSWTRP